MFSTNVTLVQMSKELTKFTRGEKNQKPKLKTQIKQIYTVPLSVSLGK